MNRRDVMKMMSAAALVPAARIPNDVFGAGQANLTREPFGGLRIYFDGPTDQLKAMTAGSLVLKPGMSPHPPHQHPEEELLIVKEGTVETLQNGKASRLGPGSIIFHSSHDLHNIRNAGKTPATYHVIQWRVSGTAK